MATASDSKIRREWKQISEWVESRGIERLYHFTSVDNLSSILEHGLLATDELRSRGIEFHQNDTRRLDTQLARTCLSIEHPNTYVLRQFRMNHPGATYVVLELRATILSDFDCLFCEANAARVIPHTEDLEHLKGLKALQSLFRDRTEKYERARTTLAKWPTDAQAEVLVEPRIPPHLISKVYFESLGQIGEMRNKAAPERIKITHSSRLFEDRPDGRDKKSLSGGTYGS